MVKFGNRAGHLFAATVFAAAWLFAGSAQAACGTKTLAGIWVGHATAQLDLYCLVDFSNKGEIVQSSCFNPRSLKPVGALSGRVTVNSQCGARGRMDLTLFNTGKVSPVVFAGKQVSAGNVLNGDFVIFGQNEDYRFYRQLD